MIKILNYALNLIKLGRIRKMSVKSTKFDDENSIIWHWKYAELIYHVTKKTKYRLESFHLLAGTKALYTPRH